MSTALILLCAGVHYLLLHGPEGQQYYVNTDQVTTLRSPSEKDLRNSFPGGTHCVVVTSNGKFLAAQENCLSIYQAIVANR